MAKALFVDRADAGRRLADRLAATRPDGLVVLGLPAAAFPLPPRLPPRWAHRST